MERQYTKIRKTLKKIGISVDPAINQLLINYVEKKHQPLVKHQMSSGGKRIRPALAILTYKMLGGKGKDILTSASGLEILHNYTLIIDDIIDHSLIRRNIPTVWKKFGKSIAQSLEMAYSGAILEASAKSKYPAKVAMVYAEALKMIGDGEIFDILFEQAGREDEDYITKNRFQKVTNKDYFKMAGKKTAILLQSSCEVGGICADATKEDISRLKKFGFNIGLAFQIQDDILDIFGDEKTIGKKIGGDIIERKLGNIIMVIFAQKASKQDVKKLADTLKKKEIKNEDIKQVVELINKTNAKQEAEKLSQKFTTIAKKQLKFLPQNIWNNELSELADFIINRKY